MISQELSQDLADDKLHSDDAALLHNQAKKCAEVLAQLSKGQDTERFLQDEAHYNYLSIDAFFTLIAEKYQQPGKTIDVLNQGDEASKPKLFSTPELRHGLGNLISNAAEFAKTAVTINLYWDEKTVRAEIRDDGPGFSPEILARLGEPYMSSRRGKGGMGLGVFIADMLIKRSRGELSFRNAKPGGAIATVKWSRQKLEKSDPFT